MAFPGGKGKSFRQVINLLPPHLTYVEPFLGSGAIVRNKLVSTRTIVNDLEPKVLSGIGKELNKAEVYNLDALTMLKGLELCPQTLIYCDPPYLQETRRKKKIYRHEFSDTQHIELIDFLLIQSCMIIVSGYSSELYERKFANWNRQTFKAQTQAGIREEVLWFNYPKPTILHDSRYIGSSFRERQNIKRRQQRLKSKIEAMCPIERADLIQWITKRYAS